MGRIKIIYIPVLLSAMTVFSSISFNAGCCAYASSAEELAVDDILADEEQWSHEETDETSLQEMAADAMDVKQAHPAEDPANADSTSGWTDIDGIIEDPGWDPSLDAADDIPFEVTDPQYKDAFEEDSEDAGEKSPVYGKLYPPAPLLEGINSFRQGDLRWALHRYGYADAACKIPATISSSGCGLLSLVNAVYYMTGCFIDPAQLADWSCAHGFRQNGVGTVHSMYQAYADTYGEAYGFAYAGTASSITQIRSFLHEEGTAIISTTHHLMCIADYDPEKGGYLLLDSAPSALRGTYPTGYRYLSDKDFSESIPVYAIILLKQTEERGSELLPVWKSDPQIPGAVSDADDLYQYIMECYLMEQRLLPVH